jgi:hypothetical protein
MASTPMRTPLKPLHPNGFQNIEESSGGSVSVDIATLAVGRNSYLCSQRSYGGSPHIPRAHAETVGHFAVRSMSSPQVVDRHVDSFTGWAQARWEYMTWE